MGVWFARIRRHLAPEIVSAPLGAAQGAVLIADCCQPVSQIEQVEGAISIKARALRTLTGLMPSLLLDRLFPVMRHEFPIIALGRSAELGQSSGAFARLCLFLTPVSRFSLYFPLLFFQKLQRLV